MPARMGRLVYVAGWKDASNIRPFIYEVMVLERGEGKQVSDFVEKAFDPCIIECLGHIEENCSSLFSSEFLGY